MASQISGGTADINDGFHLPVKILENNLLSPTSEAYECFVQQKFSGNLQAFLLDYVISISGEQSVYA